ncbi:MAG: NADP(H)-dependent aldo-keto reductase [Alphaproteobacteria bacterium]
MQYRRLGRTDIDVSVICLGTMTWGEQNSEADAHRQLDMALDAGVNFIDAAEMYPVPPRAETYGRTEEYIGSWFAGGAARDKVILATKVVGREESRFPYVRGGKTRLDRSQIEAAIDGSLRRLRTDYIDLYQLHWPDRPTNYFGRLGYAHQPDVETIPIEETLCVLGDLVKAGKIRMVGLSNETAWGVMEFLRVADRTGLPRVVSIQNPYNLLNRTFEIGLAEMAIREDVGLLAYSPLAMGVLTGKYIGGAKPEGARLTLFGDRMVRYSHPNGHLATERYVALAREHGLDPALMALAYVNSRPFVTSSIPGATRLSHISVMADSASASLPQTVIDGIDAIHREISNPCP